MAGLLDRIYAVSPLWLQNLGISAYGYAWRRQRYGGRFLQECSEFGAREAYSSEQWQHYQQQRLRALLLHAAAEVPHYREAFAAAGLTATQLGGWELGDIAALPLLEKEEVRRDPDRFVSESYTHRRLHTLKTSGTTGTPLAIKLTSDVHRSIAAAYEARCRRWAGIDYTMSRAMIGGRLVVPRGESAPPFWRYNRAERQLYMSAFHIAPGNVPHYVRAINELRPDYLVGYASSHYFLARMIGEQGLSVHSPRAVLTSSEKLTDEMREVIARTYGCEVFDGYSGVEACCLASECAYHRLHLSPDVGIVELLDEQGSAVPPGQAGEIVATGLLNFAQPLIRYRTGDQAIFSAETCPCGSAMPVLQELVGRLEDRVVGRDGREMVRFHGIFVGLPHVRQGQVIQETLDNFRLRLVVDAQFDDTDRRVLKQRFDERLGTVHLDIELVEALEITERGKFRAVISHVRPAL